MDFLPDAKSKIQLVIKINHIRENNQAYATLKNIYSFKEYYDFSQLKLELKFIFEENNNYMENFETENEERAFLINIYSPNLPSITIIDLPPI